MNDHPEAFGFHETASFAYAQTEISSLFSSILAMGGEERDTHTTFEWGGVARSSEEAAELAAANILSSLPANISPPTTPVELDNVLRSETMRYNALLTTIRTTLQRLRHAQRGLIVLTTSLEQLRKELLAGVVPQEWRARSHPSNKPLALYLRDLRMRVAFIQVWANQGAPKIMQMGALYSPKSLIMGILQQYASKYSLAIDTLTLQTEVVEAFSTDDPDAYYIDGLWKDGLLTEPQSHDTYAKLPLLKLKPKQLLLSQPNTPSHSLKQSTQTQSLASTLKHSTHAQPQSTTLKQSLTQTGKPIIPQVYSAPVYNTVSRSGPLTPMGQSTNFVMVVNLPCDHQDHYWIKRGTALFCQLPL